MPARLRPWLLGALLWLALVLLLSLPNWLNCLWNGDSPSCHAMLAGGMAHIGLSMAVMMLAAWLGMRRLAARAAPGRPRLAALIGLVLAVSLLGLMALAFTEMGRRGTVHIGQPPAYTLQTLLTQAGCMVAALHYLLRAGQQRLSAAELQREQQQLETRLDAARLQLLQAQVEPHFLFNTLAHLRRLAQTDPPEARAMLADLLGYLREALPELRAAEAELARELGLVRAYLALHQRRMGESRLRVHFDIAAGLERARLPSTALLTLAENAIKHGIAPVVTGGSVRIRARAEQGQLLLEVADTGRGMGESSGHGTGLATLRARLKALYGEAGQLQLRMNEPRGLVVSLQLPLQWAA